MSGTVAQSGKFEPVSHRFAEARARESAVDDGDKRDPALDSRQEPPRIGGEVERALRACTSASGHRLEPRLTRGNDRQLAHRQHAVHGDESENEEDVEPGYRG